MAPIPPPITAPMTASEARTGEVATDMAETRAAAATILPTIFMNCSLSTVVARGFAPMNPRLSGLRAAKYPVACNSGNRM